MPIRSGITRGSIRHHEHPIRRHGQSIRQNRESIRQDEGSIRHHKPPIHQNRTSFRQCHKFVKKFTKISMVRNKALRIFRLVKGLKRV